MNIKRDGNKSILDYRYKGQRYRPVLGYDLTPDQEQEAALRVLNSIHNHVGGDAPKAGTFAEFVPTYVKWIKAADHDLDGRNENILKCHLLDHFGAMRLQDITLDDGLNYLAKRKAAHAAKGTIERECTVLMAVLNLAIDSERLDKNRLKRLPVPKYEPRTRVLEGWELKRLLAVSSPDWKDLIMAAVQTGLRQDKLVSIDVEQSITRPDGLWIMPTRGSLIKGVPKQIPLNGLARNAFQGSIPKIGGRFFSRWAKGNSTGWAWRHLVKRAGLQDLKFHDLRHTFRTWLTMAGVDYLVAEEMMGHTLPGTGHLYIHIEWDPRMREAVDTLEAFTKNLLETSDIVAVMGSSGQSPHTKSLKILKK